MKFIVFALLMLTLTSTVAGQVKPLVNDLQKSKNPHINQYAYILADSVWPTPKIYVCWENPSDRFTSEMALVEQTVHETWAKVSKLEFTGWKRCAAKNHGIHILIDDSGPLDLFLGRRLDNVHNGMILNFTFANFSPQCQSTVQSCIKGFTVHEFGHAIGFAHEQNSPKTPGECQILKQGPSGDLLLTPYDPASVMNYCNGMWSNGTLSDLDTSAVQELYGKRQ